MPLTFIANIHTVAHHIFDSESLIFPIRFGNSFCVIGRRRRKQAPNEHRHILNHSQDFFLKKMLTFEKLMASFDTWTTSQKSK